jgi:hypothetical protein
LAALKKGAAKKKYGAYVVVGFHPTTTYSTLISAEKPFFSRVKIGSRKPEQFESSWLYYNGSRKRN